MMKKIIFVLIVLSLLIISGCGKSKDITGDVIKETINYVCSDGKTTVENIEDCPEKTLKEETVSGVGTYTPTKGAGTYTPYSMNQDIKVDYLTYKITKAQTFTKMGSSIFEKETNGKFIKVYLDITNNAKETKDMFSSRFRLIDEQERKFDELSDGMLYISDYITFGKQLQPGLTTSGAIIFEIPKDSTNLKLEISGDWVSTTNVLVPISNINDIGIDTTLKDKQDEIIDRTMKESEEKVNEIMSQCNSPFVCTSSCSEYMDVGQKDCSSEEVCCLQS